MHAPNASPFTAPPPYACSRLPSFPLRAQVVLCVFVQERTPTLSSSSPCRRYATPRCIHANKLCYQTSMLITHTYPSVRDRRLCVCGLDVAACSSCPRRPPWHSSCAPAASNFGLDARIYAAIPAPASTSSRAAGECRLIASIRCTPTPLRQRRRRASPPSRR